MNELAALEAVLFVTEAPIPIGELSEVLELPKKRVQELLDDLAEAMAERESGLALRSTAGGWRLYSHPEAFPYLERFSRSATARKLSNAALETLAIVAYRQPVSRGQISEIRGVDSESAVGTLERLGFIEETGRLSVHGNPAVYQTTDLFLEKLGLDSVSDLPPLADHVPSADVVVSLEDSLRPGSA